MDRMIQPLRRPFDFAGRSPRSEFWLFVLFLFVAVSVLSIVETLLGLGSYDRTVVTWPYGYAAEVRQHAGPLSGLFILLMIIPTLAVAVRRLHDSDHSGWWLLIGMIPVAGGLVLLIFYLLRGTAGANRWGGPPLPGVEAAAPGR